MIKLNCLFYPGLLLLLIVQVNSDCKLDQTNIRNSRRIFTFRSGNELHLLRVNEVPTGQDLEVFFNNGNVTKVTCDQNGKFVPQLPVDIDVKTDLSTAVSSPHSTCNYTMLRVGFQLPGQFLELYRTCFDEAIRQAHFSVHHLYRYSVDAGPREDIWAKHNEKDNGVEISYTCDSILKCFVDLFGSGQTYIVKNPRNNKICSAFDRGHLAPNLDFAYQNYRRATFKYINAVPQFTNSNRGYWQRLEAWVRKFLKGTNYTNLQICTGAKDRLKLPYTDLTAEDIFLYPRNISDSRSISINPVPKWMYKVVSYGRTILYAFVGYNNVETNADPGRLCNNFDCPFEISTQPNQKATKRLNQDAAKHFHCCDPNEFVNKHAQHCNPKEHEDQVPLQLFPSNPAVPKRTHNIPPSPVNSIPVQKKGKASLLY